MAESAYEAIEKKQRKEQYDRLTMPSHVQVEHFSEHQKLEGYYESERADKMFKCDRLLKMENMFGRLQMGYNPNRGKSFIFANIKTSRYDTAASSINREANEYDMKSLTKGGNENRVYVSKHRDNVAVLLEKAENKPWTEYSIRSYLNRANMQTLIKVMPFLQAEKDRRQRQEVADQQRQLMAQEAENYRQHKASDNDAIRQQLRELSNKSDDLRVAIYRKEQQSKLFFRKINYAIDYQKHEMFEYYKEQRERRLQELEADNEPNEDEDED